MSWKRNVFGCLMWVIYLPIVGAAMIFTGRVICDTFGLAEYFEIAVSAGYLLFAGVLVFVLHRMAVKLEVSSRSAGKGLLWLEGLAVLALFAVGLFLRVTSLQSASYAVSEESAYFRLAYISADGQGIPQSAHGAVCLYLWALRLCFILLGNKAAVAVWLQIGLQMLGVWMLYFAVRKMAGKISAVMMLAFFMLSPYMVDKALLLSPEMLYLLGFSFVMLLVSRGVEVVSGWGFWLIASVLAAALCYLDVAGFLLLPLMLGVIVMRQQGVERKIARGLFGCLIGFTLGVGACILADMMSSGRPVLEIVSDWAELYQWGELQLSVTISDFSILWMITLLLCFMAWGIFSFWCGRGVERFSMWIFGLGFAVVLQGLGIFTEEMNGFCYIFFFSTVLAGLGIRESMAFCPAEEFGGKTAKDKAATTDAQDAGQGQDAVDDGRKSGESTGQSDTDGEVSSGGNMNQNAVSEEGKTGENTGQSDTDGEVQSGGNMSQNDDVTNHEAQSSEDKEQMAGEKKEAVEEKETMEEKDKPERKDGAEEKPKIEFIENPLPLPKKHEKRVMDYKLDPGQDLGGYDVYVADDDDFDH